MTAPPEVSVRRATWPADYYSSATPEPVLPRWAALGCGGASVLLLAVLFGGGILLSTGRFTDLMDLMIGMSVGEMKGMYTEDVEPERRASVDAEIERLREGLRNDEFPFTSLQPFLEAMRNATKDGSVTPEEAEYLERVASRIGTPAR
ncbi:MAG TPA: hypothetical protein VF701_18345 [Thermoanaerobaculia bacterium]